MRAAAAALLLLLLARPGQAAAPVGADEVLGVAPTQLKMGLRVWREFIREPRNGIDLLVDCIRAYPDADKVLGSLANETGLPVDRVREALAPLALNLLLSYTKIFAITRSEAKLRLYMRNMGRFYREKNINENEYTTLNSIIDKHVHKKLRGRFRESDLSAPLAVLDGVKQGIFQTAGAAAEAAVLSAPALATAGPSGPSGPAVAGGTAGGGSTGLAAGSGLSALTAPGLLA